MTEEREEMEILFLVQDRLALPQVVVVVEVAHPQLQVTREVQVQLEKLQ
jgi:hypothetical protein